MAAPIECYFDFSSPFGYLAGEKIDPLAAKYGARGHVTPFPPRRGLQDHRRHADDAGADQGRLLQARFPTQCPLPRRRLPPADRISDQCVGTVARLLLARSIYR